MRLAKFTLTNGVQIAVNPKRVSISTEEGDSKVVNIQQDNNPEPYALQGTFEEAVDEVNTALNETHMKVFGKLEEDPK